MWRERYDLPKRYDFDFCLWTGPKMINIMLISYSKPFNYVAPIANKMSLLSRSKYLTYQNSFVYVKST